jgi:hypothetical protein
VEQDLKVLKEPQVQLDQQEHKEPADPTGHKDLKGVVVQQVPQVQQVLKVQQVR